MQQDNTLNWKQQENPQELDLSYCVFVNDQQFIQYLQTKEALVLKSLNISHTLLSDAALFQLTYLNTKNLRYLDIGYCINFTEGAIVNLINSNTLQHIEVIDLSGNHLSDICLKFILQTQRMKGLANIKLNDIRKGQQGFGYSVFEILSKTTLSQSLTYLSLANSFIGYDSLNLNKPQKLFNTILHKLQKDDNTFGYQLSFKSTQITHLILNRCELVTNKFFKSLCHNVVFLSTIRHLDISHCRYITDKTLKYFSDASMPAVQRLMHLEIAGLKITQFGLDKLGKSKALALSHINISMCEDITNAEVKLFLDSRLGRGLQSIEISGSGAINCQLAGCFVGEFQIQTENALKSIQIEVFHDKQGYYIELSQEQKQYQMSNSGELDSYYKSFIQCYFVQIVEQLVLSRRVKVCLKVPYQDERILIKFITQFIEQTNLLNCLQFFENVLFVNQLSVLQSLHASMDVDLKNHDASEPINAVSLIQSNYINPISQENIQAYQIRNLILIGQVVLSNTDLKLIADYQDTIFQQLQYLSIKGCKQITMEGINALGDMICHQLNTLDVRKTGINCRIHIPRIQQQCKNLLVLNNNKIEILILQKHNLEQVECILSGIEQLSSIKHISIINESNKHPAINLKIIRTLSNILWNHQHSLMKFGMSLWLIKQSNFMGESLQQLFEGIHNSIKLHQFYIGVQGHWNYSSYQTMLQYLSHIRVLHINLLNCELVNAQSITQQPNINSVQKLNISAISYQDVDCILQSCNQLQYIHLNIKIIDCNVHNLQKLLIYSSGSLIEIHLIFNGIPLKQFLEIFQQTCFESMISLKLELENTYLDDYGLFKIQEIISHSKKLNTVQIYLMGCQLTTNQIEKHFKSNLQVLRIPDLKICY